MAKFCRCIQHTWQNFAAVFNILQKILPKNEPKFMEKRGAVGFKTGSRQVLKILCPEKTDPETSSG
ncbi:MAG: hypothetical protein A2794_03385 [Alphaproteobacteria bacterium RIFCSPHIGHO2_01_FULL_40_8]|nr:MAG: hypothetical protein A2794_03385 [Alphaproteobacteria bacterium RIFCSPHIGHO2_01_FULL_40_8]